MWWETDSYKDHRLIPDVFDKLSGPEGPACVRVWPNGSTDPGWGKTPDKRGNAFMENYSAGRFGTQMAEIGAASGRWDFAFVMRSLMLVAIDIDGKNGGLENAKKLGLLPETLAETSRSGDGYHLFYATPEDAWHSDEGYAMYRDRIGIYQGVDIRGVGCVYHYPTQAWNERPVADLPDFLHEKLTEAPTVAGVNIVQAVDEGDPDKLLLVRTTLEEDLAKPIPSGRRNNTLFAIGTKMKLAGVPNWDNQINSRALAVGLDHQEAAKIVSNIHRYGTAAAVAAP